MPHDKHKDGKCKILHKRLVPNYRTSLGMNLILHFFFYALFSIPQPSAAASCYR